MKINRYNAVGVWETAFDSDNITNSNLSPSAGIVDTKLATISTANKVSLSALDIDGAAEIGAALVDADVFPVDDGAGGTNRKSLMSRVATYIFAKVSNHITISSTGTATLAANSVASSNIVDGTIVNGDINASAAIAYSKLTLNNSIVTADIQNGQITNAKLNTTAGELGGAWTTWSPTWTNLTVGNGTVVARYTTIGKTVHFILKFTYGSTSDMTGAGRFSLPVEAQADHMLEFFTTFLDSSTGATFFGYTAKVSTTEVKFRVNIEFGGELLSDASATVPYSDGGATNDVITIHGTYERT